ncbi:MAG: tetratricopeptide repeat protein [Pseudolabrys sp.]
MRKHDAMMLRAILAASLLLMTIVGAVAAGTYKDALAAYNNRDYATALPLFRSLARAGDARAQYKLGVMYLMGQGVKRNEAEALKWLRKSNEEKKAFEAYNRGDYATALRLYRPLANRGEPTAQYVMGLMYANDQGVPQSYAAAMNWHKKVAEEGEALGQFSVGVMYLKGLGVRKNYAEAAKWFQKAADQGNAKAQYNLGSMYVKGEGVGQNYVRADLLLSLAAGQGIQAAKKARDKLLKSMTSAQIAEAQKLARNWKPKAEK